MSIEAPANITSIITASDFDTFINITGEVPKTGDGTQS